VPKGSHKVVLSFFPKSVDTTETIAYVAFALLIVALIAACAIQFRRKKAAPNA
jgi:cytochrome bd-type quinol oxidase subunit 2